MGIHVAYFLLHWFSFKLCLSLNFTNGYCTDGFRIEQNKEVHKVANFWTGLNSLCKRQREGMAVQACPPTLNLVAVVTKEPIQINSQQLVLAPSCNNCYILLCSSLRLYLNFSSPLLSLSPQPSLILSFFPWQEQTCPSAQHCTNYGRIAHRTLQ